MEKFKVNGLSLTEQQAVDLLMQNISVGVEQPVCEYDGKTGKLDEFVFPAFELPDSDNINEIRNFCIEQSDFCQYSMNVCNVNKLSVFPYHVLIHNKQRMIFFNIKALLEYIRR